MTTRTENEYQTFNLLRKVGFNDEDAARIANEIYDLTGLVINSYFKKLSDRRHNRIIKS